MATTFAVSQVERRTERMKTWPLGRVLRHVLRGSVEACGASADTLAPFRSHGFVSAVHIAFDRHYPLVLTPDAVWLCIAQGFAAHVRLHAETLRKRLVSHEGRATLEIRRDDFVKGSPTNPWPEVLGAFSDAIAAYGDGARRLVVSSFSTTGPAERAASEIVLMDTLRRYFDYHVGTLCGIPEIALAGTPEDWRSIRQRVEQLAPYDLAWWVDALRPVLDQVVASAEGRADPAFWTSFFKRRDSSGGPFVTGWINVLFPYLLHHRDRQIIRNEYVWRWPGDSERGAFGATGPEILSGLSCAPFTWRIGGTAYPMQLVGGFAGIAQDPETLAVRPVIGWAVRDEQAETAEEPTTDI